MNGGPLLRHRAEALRERMDEPDCDPTMLDRTYGQFAVLNQLLSGWHAAWTRTLRPAARAAAADRGVAELLDVGCGGGDLARRLAAWAARDGVPLRIVAIDPDRRALAFARRRAVPPSVTFRDDDALDLAADGARFDLVVSNHVLHHLTEDEVATFLRASDLLARNTVLHNDLRRNPLAIPAFALFSLPFRGSYIREDGFRSIRRAYLPSELRPQLPPGFEAKPVGWFRQWVVRGARR
ncbi:MAG: methyltransferase domain-containing protein [Trueperaceae bacterium]|nr:methyltransferase domain-containing protein [Trueperaceae bacterium]